MMKGRNQRNRILALLLTVILMIGIIPSAGVRPAQAKTTNSITVGAVHTGKLAIAVKSNYKLEAKAKTGRLTYKSSKPAVAKVTKKGVVKGAKPGKATITIKGKGVSKKVKVTVVKKNKYKKVKKITIKGASKTMYPGDSQKLKISFKPANSSNKNLKFKSSKKSVAEVTAKGQIKAKSPGTAKITVTSCANKKAKAKITITVKKDNRYTVTFDSMGGTEVATQKVEPGKKAKKPADPILSGATFAGWFLEGDEKAFDFSNAINENITLYARWDVKVSELTKDGEVDPGDLALLEAAGKIEVMGDTDSTAPRAIIGTFTDKKVTGKASAVNVLKSLETVFDKAIDAEGNQVDTDFVVREKEIVVEEVDTPATEDGKDAPKEFFYKYFPEIDSSSGAIPVEGAEIILCTDAQGTVTGLHSTYDAVFRTLDPVVYSENNAARARRTAISYLERMRNDDGTPLLPQDTYVSLDTDEAELVLYTGKSTDIDSDAAGADGTEGKREMPLYAYKVHVYTEKGEGVIDSDPPEEDDREDDMDEDPGNGGNPSGQGSDTTIPFIDYTVYVDASDITKVHHSIDNLHAYKWKSCTAELPCLQNLYSGTKFVDMRYAKLNASTTKYEYYDSGRKISVFQTRQYLIDKDGNGYYGSPNYNNTTAMTTNRPSKAPTANTLLFHAEKVYDFYKNVLGRNSYNGKGANLYIGYYTDFGDTGFNAYWSSNQKKIFFTFPTTTMDLTRCLDVMGHEFTHGMINYKVGTTGKGFDYKYESGALEEAYCDIMGTLIERKEQGTNWDIGEDQAKDGTSQPLRRLGVVDTSAGQTYQYKDRYKGSEDQGGVHINATIFGHAFYNMVTDKRLTGEEKISYDTWAQLFYRSLSRLSITAKLRDGRYAVLAEARAMKFTGLQQLVISDAFDSVGLSEPQKITLTLTWGKTPKDLDIRLIGPDGNSYFVVNHLNKIFVKNDQLMASLDQDARSGNGTEVIKIQKLENGDYYCLVNYPAGGDDKDSTEMGKSDAHVVVNYGNQKPRNYYAYSKAKGTYWLACKIKVRNGEPTFYKFDRDFDDGSGGLYRYGGKDLLDLVLSRY